MMRSINWSEIFTLLSKQRWMLRLHFRTITVENEYSLLLLLRHTFTHTEFTEFRNLQILNGMSRGHLLTQTSSGNKPSNLTVSVADVLWSPALCTSESPGC